MSRTLVYDLPTRLFHWIFAILFLTSFSIAKTAEDDSPWFAFHSLSGLTLGFLILLRIVWGVVGTKHARFRNFDLNPNSLFEYFRNILTGTKKLWAGHNPASSWSAVIMLVLGLGLALSGYRMTLGPDREAFEDVHELFANSFLVVVVLHVAGILIHSIRHRDLIGLSMVDGRKSLSSSSAEQPLASQKAPVAILLVGLLTTFGIYLYKNYNAQTGILNFMGSSLQLIDATEYEVEQQGRHEREDKEDNGKIE